MTGWPRDYILEDLEFAEGLAILHAERVANGAELEWNDGSEPTADRRKREFENVLNVVNPDRKRA